MIVAAWRQHRFVTFVVLAVVAALAVWLAVTGTMQENAWRAFQPASRGGCVAVAGSVCAAAASRYYSLGNLSGVSLWLLLAVPPLLGLVLGAPLVAREIEQRTNRMAWTQSITRTRWLFVKLGVGAVSCVAIAAALAPLVEWWTGATHRVPRISPATFDVAGVTPIAYTLFAFVLGAAIGSVVRRTGWAFAIGLPIYAGVRLLLRYEVRPDLVTPTSVLTSSDAKSTGAPYSASAPGWEVHAGYVPLGRVAPATGQNWQGGEERIADCTALQGHGHAGAANAWSLCTEKLNLHWVEQVQPASHFWPLQGLEAAIFAAIAIGLVGVAVLAVLRWRT